MSSVYSVARARSETPVVAPSFGEQSNKVVADVRELGRMAVSNVADAARRMRDRGADALEAGQAKLRVCRRQFEDGVADNPLMSVLIAASIGGAIGYLMRRRGERSRVT